MKTTLTKNACQQNMTVKPYRMSEEQLRDYTSTFKGRTQFLSSKQRAVYVGPASSQF